MESESNKAHLRAQTARAAGVIQEKAAVPGFSCRALRDGC